MRLDDILLENLRAFGAWLTRHRRPLLRWSGIAGAIVLLPVLALYMLPVVLGWFATPVDLSKDLYAINRPIAFTFLDASGKVVGHRGAIVGDRLKLKDMPAYLPGAFIAMEDRNFYSHNGIDPQGLLRATIMNIRAGHIVAGGSTITQQTAKILYTQQERTFGRALSVLMHAAALEKALSKDEILQLYLNRIYLGSGAYGVDGAARVYFGKSAREVTLSEAAMLATLTRAPSVFTPRRDLPRAQERATIVLHTMVETGAITQAQADDAIAHPAVVTDRVIADARNFFLDTAADEALKLVDPTGGAFPTADLVVTTTLEPKLQEVARKSLSKTLRTRGVKMHASEGAVVLMKPDGAVSALIGGTDYDASVFNRATQARRQPGSSFKPFVYLAAIENGISPWDVRDDGPVDIDGWSPTNYGGRSYGTITLASALAHSVNTITASLAQEVGVTTVVEAAQRCGITSPLEANASLALGTSEVTPIEMATAYATFASGGLKIEPYFVTRVDANDGRTLYKRKPPEPQRVIASHVDRDLTAMLYGVMTEGTGIGAQIPGHEAAGKTGTTQDYHDAWFVGFTADYVAAVWVGNDDSSPMKNVTGATLPGTVWKTVMTAAEANLPAKPLDKSAPQPVEGQGVFFSSSGVDTETGGATIVGNDDQTGQNSEAQTQRPRQGNNSFWDWLFGRERQRRQTPSSQQPAVPQQDSQDGQGDQNSDNNNN
ncbi:MAG: PBP1A family penicillin-binding protein [Proteobacteria bacterium]|nr:PBP1A family penicillin-binding protein [Pseudomonadota bacterium]